MATGTGRLATDRQSQLSRVARLEPRKVIWRSERRG
jgi:hypothetical protein